MSHVYKLQNDLGTIIKAKYFVAFIKHKFTRFVFKICSYHFGYTVVRSNTLEELCFFLVDGNRAVLWRALHC